MGKLANLNRYQKAARRGGECRVNGPEIQELIRLAYSEDAEDRLLSASYLCPCHVRKRIDEAWEALYRMMEDPDVRVRQRAWHTLEDGGGGETECVQQIADRVWQTETDPQVRALIEEVCGSRLERRRILDRAARAPVARTAGKCDFCGATGVPVREDYGTPIPDGRGSRAARVCGKCDAP